jgi:OFA family oxalate/formate antiporter-like MFS transporter
MTGRVAGVVVSGFGLAPVYTAPLSKWMIDRYGVPSTFLYLGIAFGVVVVLLAQLLRAPHKALQFIAGRGPLGEARQAVQAPPAARKPDFAPREVLATGVFYWLWFMYACSAGAGLMIISKLAKMADAHSGIKYGALLVTLLAVGNGAGRILAGGLSDRIGRKATFALCALLQAAVIFCFSLAKTGSPLATLWVLIAISLLVGANYGANLALFPAITKDFFGLRNFGVNYGLVFTAWGMGGFMLSQVAGKLYDKYHTFNIAFYGSVALLILAAAVTPLVRPPRAKSATA